MGLQPHRFNFAYFLKTLRRSEKRFFLITNQNNENPPAPAATVEPIAIPAIAPSDRPSFSSVLLSEGSFASVPGSLGSASVPGVVVSSISVAV